ncbi:hypothetical protein [Litorilituus lipolyticus]|uniref:Uncharacterized protein n=1 Tax=Litorilituus lipolyticus TaxID=2491017 RepID=A0A502L7I3_9GAMM|nr:hypothetical protein [Litorilituus lipolyticus]TPH18043.1 hypothetical protein EPA86_02700 [Litorilituus lipolyticus]
MRSFKLLLASSIITTALCTSLYSFAAQPLAVQPVVNAKTNMISYNNLTSSAFNNSIKTTTVTFSANNDLTHTYSSPKLIGNKHNQFFEAAVNFNETLQQVISFFSSDEESLVAEPEQPHEELEEEVSIAKCKASYS